MNATDINSAITFNNTGLTNTTTQLTNLATDFGGLIIKIVLALFILYFFYKILKSVAK
jgi:predicted PurR-regulated permease PerM